MSFFSHYFLFFLKLLTGLALILICFSLFLYLLGRNKQLNKGKLEIQHLNEIFETYENLLTQATQTKKDWKKWLKAKKKQTGNPHSLAQTSKRIFVLNFVGDIRASALHTLREEITAILTIATPSDEVVIRLESQGGLMHAYGLAASQLQRIKNAQIPLRVAIDKVAASGGYLMACVADSIMAAPFAIIGSIGVLAQLPNFHRLLQKKSIDFEQLTAGEYKRPWSLFGENTEKGRQKVQEEIESAHTLFKNFITQHRTVNIEQVATGEHWHASEALTLKLVDELKTSDEYLLAQTANAQIYEINYRIKRPFNQRFTGLFMKLSNHFIKTFH